LRTPIIESEKRALERKEKCAAELVEHLKQHFRPRNYNLPVFQFVEGLEDVENLLSDIVDRWRVRFPQGARTIWGYQDHSFTEHYGRYLEYRWRTRPKNEQLRIFTNRALVEDNLKRRDLGRQIRTAPEGIEFASNMWIFGDVIFLAQTREDPHYGIVVQSEALAQNAQTIFEWLWKLASD
jgi:hypothetical protein